MTQLVLPVLAAVAMLGVALVTTMRAERRREIRHQRLRALAAMGPIDNDEPTTSLRRPLSRTAIRDFFLLSALWARLDAALAATGNKIGAPHLVATGLIAAAVVMAFSAKVMSFTPILIVLLGAAAGLGAAVQLLRLAQTRYQNQFLDLFPDAL
jgi:Flp pilus assembly protein TadB